MRRKSRTGRKKSTGMLLRERKVQKEIDYRHKYVDKQTGKQKKEIDYRRKYVDTQAGK
jgi:hypothetical protein